MTAEELIRRAAACQDCGKEHRYVWRSENFASWAAGGHDYRPVIGEGEVARLRWLLTGKWHDPWAPVTRRKLARTDAQP